MAKAELGEKRRCLSCNTPFFDLGRTPILCPKCAAVFTVIEFVRSPPRRHASMRANPFVRPAPAVASQAVAPADMEEELATAATPAESAAASKSSKRP